MDHGAKSSNTKPREESRSVLQEAEGCSLYVQRGHAFRKCRNPRAAGSLYCTFHETYQPAFNLKGFEA